MVESTKRLVKKGNVIVLKQEVADVELNDKHVLENIKGLKDSLAKCLTDKERAQEAIAFCENEEARLQVLLKDISKFEQWALELQESRAKAFVEKLVPEGKEHVEKEFSYKQDAGLTPEQNVAQEKAMRFRRLQDFIGRNKEVAESLHPLTIKRCFYTDCIIPNPWL